MFNHSTFSLSLLSLNLVQCMYMVYRMDSCAQMSLKSIINRILVEMLLNENAFSINIILAI